MSKQALRASVAQLWPDVKGEIVMGLGYALPLLRPYQAQADFIAAVMPAQQGCIHWPREGPFRTVLTYEDALPFADCSFTRIIIMHGVEGSDAPRALLNECWRVLKGQGRIILIVPNRLSLWARSERTPFGYGRPYSQAQITKLLQASRFTPLKMDGSLYFPPSSSHMLLKTTKAWSWLGRNFCASLAGVHVVEAVKQIYATTQPVPVRKLLPSLGMVDKPKPVWEKPYADSNRKNN